MVAGGSSSGASESGGPRRWDRPGRPAGNTPPPAGTDGPGAAGDVAPGSPETDADPLPWDLFDGDPVEGPQPPNNGGGRRWLVVAALVPWLIVGAVLLRTPTEPTPATAPHDDHASGAHASAEDQTEISTTASMEGDPWAEPIGIGENGALGVQPPPDALVFGPRVAAGPGEAAAMALLVAREWLGTVGPRLDTDVAVQTGSRYVEHLAVEDVDMPAPDAAVVTVVAVLLSVEDGSYHAAEAVRIAVPIRLVREGARPAGPPWRLPAPDLRSADLETRPIEDPTVSADAGAALLEAGYAEVDVLGVASSEAWPLVVTAEAVAPGEATSRRHEVWLRRHLDRLVVAGWLPDVTTDVDGRAHDARTEQDQGGAPSPATTEDDR